MHRVASRDVPQADEFVALNETSPARPIEPGSWISSLSWQYAHYHFGGTDPFFWTVRKDRENTAEFAIMNRYLSYKRFSPRLTLGYADRQSDIELFSYDRAYARIGVVSDF